MSEYADKTLKFLQNNPYDVTLAANEPETGQSDLGKIWRRYKIVEGTYRCSKKGIDGKEIPGGEDKLCDVFFASEKLHEKIQEGNFGEGYKLTITKVYDTEIFKFPFFKVEPQGQSDNAVEKATMEEAVDMVAKNMDVNQTNKVVNDAPEQPKKMSGQERLEFVEEKVKILWQERQKASGHTTAPEKPEVTEDDLPF